MSVTQKVCFPQYRLRSGYLMIDMLITMAIITTLFSIYSVWIHKTFLYCSAVSERDLHQRTISRIGRELRNESSLAESITISGGSISLIQGGIETVYTIENHRVSRTQIGENRTAMDQFTFATNAKISWIRGKTPNEATLEIRRDFSDFTVSKEANYRLDAQIRVRAKSVERSQ